MPGLTCCLSDLPRVAVVHHEAGVSGSDSLGDCHSSVLTSDLNTPELGQEIQDSCCWLWTFSWPLPIFPSVIFSYTQEVVSSGLSYSYYIYILSILSHEIV